MDSSVSPVSASTKSMWQRSGFFMAPRLMVSLVFAEILKLVLSIFPVAERSDSEWEVSR